MRTEALLTPMDVPLGRAVGNANEVVESIETLEGTRAGGRRGAVRAAGGAHAGAGRRRAATTTTPSGGCGGALASGAGLEKFRAIIEAQGGDPRVIDDYGRLPQPRATSHWPAPRDGVVTRSDAELVGRAAVALGAGRDRADAGVDPAAGIDIVAPVGHAVRPGRPGSAAGVSRCGAAGAARALLDEAVTIGDRRRRRRIRS